MKKFFILTVILTLFSTIMNAETLEVKYCTTYSDFVAGNWKSVESLTEGRTKQMCQLKCENNQYKIKTGDKAADAFLKKEALAIEYGGHIYVNCRNLRCDGVVLETSNYAQAYRYDGDKLCVVSHYTNDAAFLASIACDVVAWESPLPVALPAAAASGVLWFNLDKLSNFRCYILDQDANEKGKSAITRITDEKMEKILSDSPELLERYNAVSKKRSRQSAANIIPVLVEKGLVKEL